MIIEAKYDKVLQNKKERLNAIQRLDEFVRF